MALVEDDCAWQLGPADLRVRHWCGEAAAAVFDCQSGQIFLVPADHARVIGALASGKVLSESVLMARFEGLDVCRILQELEKAGFLRRLEETPSES